MDSGSRRASHRRAGRRFHSRGISRPAVVGVVVGVAVGSMVCGDLDGGRAGGKKLLEGGLLKGSWPPLGVQRLLSGERDPHTMKSPAGVLPGGASTSPA